MDNLAAAAEMAEEQPVTADADADEAAGEPACRRATVRGDVPHKHTENPKLQQGRQDGHSHWRWQRRKAAGKTLSTVFFFFADAFCEQQFLTAKLHESH